MNNESAADAAFDGNVMAGPLSEVFAVDITTAQGRCRGCGTTSVIATLRVYGPDPGLVGRCPGCDDVLVRIVRTPDAVWLDLAGLTSLRVAVPAGVAGVPASSGGDA
ncbi:hypothetical protein N865_20590 [Intrasporangium oryzae NRRL B-24470]|uniref:Uncharacterized protein n=1 Tax=Intrasporangium oryzae NRRL B-24470 TaxID=1386089 RepID=W9G9W3_9MICO|nr:DUF6510 family protein [Intrasporangium oryzae]EWT01997.1 hypothetical protein N865_20590 [Intrasporangium oryzae NRRL B-24470]